ncbi:DUF2634 domain-containing protein [Bacillus sp. JJ722]|uniref:DUF2634 domain-containing protein n=1 Tax=Bacillus sp. JJ722 TaxID=3122973 RepID=UPI003000763F
MFPEIDESMIPEENTEETSKAAYYGKSFLFDFDKGEFVFENGKMVVVTGKEALKVWITKVLKTEKFRFKIYEKEEEKDTEYGVTIEDLVIGHNFSQAFIESELKREIEVALLRHPLIDFLSDFRFEREKSLLIIYFTVNIVDDESFNQEVSFNREQ